MRRETRTRTPPPQPPPTLVTYHGRPVVIVVGCLELTDGIVKLKVLGAMLALAEVQEAIAVYVVAQHIPQLVIATRHGDRCQCHSRGSMRRAIEHYLIHLANTAQLQWRGRLTPARCRSRGVVNRSRGSAPFRIEVCSTYFSVFRAADHDPKHCRRELARPCVLLGDHAHMGSTFVRCCGLSGCAPWRRRVHLERPCLRLPIAARAIRLVGCCSSRLLNAGT